MAAILIFVLGDRFFPSGPETVTVPNLKAKTVDEATTSLTNVGLILGEETPQADNNVPKGTIIGQDPAAGELLEVGQAVNIIVSAGKDQTSVPSLVGLTSKDAAKSALEAAQLVLGRVTPEESDKPEGTVLEQDIEANTKVDVITVEDGSVAEGTVIDQTPAAKELAVEGTIITITVAKTPAPIKCEEGSTVPWDEKCPEPSPTPTPEVPAT